MLNNLSRGDNQPLVSLTGLPLLHFTAVAPVLNGIILALTMKDAK